jgi:hypothetical protein
VGQLQTFANGIDTNKTRTAFQLAAQPVVPRQYVSRYGSFAPANAAGGCLNCRAWGKQS